MKKLEKHHKTDRKDLDKAQKKILTLLGQVDKLEKIRDEQKIQLADLKAKLKNSTKSRTSSTRKKSITAEPSED